MKQFFLLSLFLCAFALVFGQMKYPAFVNAPSGLNMRQEASTKSKIVARIPFGDEVILIMLSGDALKEKIVIGGVEGQWQEAIYKGIKGYVFNPYVSPGVKRNNPDFPKNAPQFIFPGTTKDNYDPVFFNPNLKWHAVVAETDKVMIYPTKVYINSDSIWSDHPDARFLFGFPDSIPARPTSLSPWQHDITGAKIPHQVYPGQRYTLGSDWHLTATGTVKPEADFNWPGFHDYQLRLSKPDREKGWSSQTIFGGLGERRKRLASVYYYGLLDQDDIPDIILEIPQESGFYNELYLSSYAETGKFLKRIATAAEGGYD